MFWGEKPSSITAEQEKLHLFKLKEVKWTPKSMNLGKSSLKTEKNVSGLFCQKPTGRRVPSGHAAEGVHCCNLLCDVRLATWCPAIALPLSAGGVE